MANKVTQSDIQVFNELYAEVKTYAEVARRTGFSASTVKKYIVPGYIKKADVKFEPVSKELVSSIEDYIAPRAVLLDPYAMILTDEEVDGMVSLWEALSL